MDILLEELCNNVDEKYKPALIYAIRLIKKSKSKIENKPNRAGAPWKQQEIDELIQECKNEDNIKDISSKHNRSFTAIKTRIDKLKEEKLI